MVNLRCGNCRKFFAVDKDADGKRIGWCDEFAGVVVRDDDRCDGAAFKEKAVNESEASNENA